MKKVLNGDVLKKVRKYSVVKGDSYSDGRCITIDVGFNNVLICFNEKINQVALCEVNGNRNDILAVHILLELIKLSQVTEYNEMEEVIYKDYLENVQLLTSCCEYNCSSCKFYESKRVTISQYYKNH